MHRCNGWAYEPCGQPATLACRYVHSDGYWVIYHLCAEHAAKVIDGAGTETDEPVSRTWCSAKYWSDLILVHEDAQIVTR